MTRPQALVLSPLFPYPETGGGKIRTLWTTRFLAERFSVDFLSFYKQEQELEGRAKLLELCREVHSVPVPARPVRPKWRSILSNVLRPGPDFTEDFASDQFETSLAELLARHRYRLIVCEHSDMAQYLPPARLRSSGQALDAVLVAHNVETTKAWRQVSTSRGFRRAYELWELARTFWYERRAARRFDLVVACSEVDEKRLKQWYGVTRTAVIPNGVDCRHFAMRGAATGQDILLMGGLGYPPNREAARLFLGSVLPELRGRGLRHPVRILGGAPTPELERLAASGGDVAFPGLVPDVRPWLERAAALAVPLEVGGGTRLKVLTAMASGTPVVSTSVGVEGLGVTSGQEALVADDPVRFAEALVSLLDGPTEDSIAMVRRARQLVEQRYDWPILGQRLLSTYETLLAD